MKLVKVFMGLCFLFVLSGCETEEVVENALPEVVISEEPIDCVAGFCFVKESPTWAQGIDEEDGEIPCAFDFENVNFDVAGTYEAKCTVTDSDGDSAESSFTIVVKENTPPVAMLVAPGDIEFELGEEIKPYEWAYGVDEEDGVLPCDFDLDEVNFHVPGTYTATCTVEDKNGDSDTTSVPIIVEDKTPPVVQKMSSHNSVFKVGEPIDFYSNIMIYDNYDETLDIVVDDSLLEYSTPGIYDVTYTVTDDSGNVGELVIPYTLTELVLPTFTEEITFDQEHIWVDYEVIDPDGLFVRMDLEIRKEGEPFMVDSFFDVEYDIEIPGIPSNTPFTVTVTYLYDVNDERMRKIRSEEILSDSWELPELDLIVEEKGVLEYDLHVPEYDPDGVLLDSSLVVEDEYGNDLLDLHDVGDGVYPVAVPFTGHDYTFTLTYHYNRNDGTGIHEVVIVEVHTIDVPSVPSIVVTNEQNLVDRFILEFMFDDSFFVLSDIEINVYTDEIIPPVFTIDTPSHGPQLLDVMGLEPGTMYDVVFTYSYDLLDGNGPQLMEQTVTTYTHIFQIMGFSITGGTVVLGQDAEVEITVYNPIGLDIINVTVNGVIIPLTPVSASPGGMIVYSFIYPGSSLVEGENILTIESVTYLNFGIGYEAILNYNNVIPIIVQN